MPKAYRPCPQFEAAGGVYQKVSSAPWDSSNEIGLDTTKQVRTFRFDAAEFVVDLFQDPVRYVASVDGTGSVVWSSSFVLAELLTRGAVPGIPVNLEGRSVIELGAGLGLCSIVCAKLGASKILATDGSEGVVELLARNAQVNLPLEPSFKAMRLQWGDLEATAPLGKFDIVVLADVTYGSNRGSWAALVATVQALCTKGTMVVWAHASRDDDSRFESPVFQSELLAPFRSAFAVSQIEPKSLHPAYAKSNLRVFSMKRRQ
jgi:2-polyprenyl-3-methyl-5-hydroxy-6-metoxy-1,4-benzoquinol methylase